MDQSDGSLSKRLESGVRDPYEGGMRNVWVLTVSMLALSICYTMLVPFLPVYLLELGVSEGSVAMWSGVTFSITFLIAGIMAPIWGKMADSRGKKLMAIRAGIGIGIAYGMTGFVTNPWELLATRALQGFANGFLPAAMTMVSLSVPKERVGRALGIFQTGLILGNVIGPLLGGMVESVVGMRPVFYVAAIVLFLVTAAVALWVKEPKLESVSKADAADDGTIKPAHQNTSIWDDLKMAGQNPVLAELLWLFFIMQGSILMLQPILALYVGQMQGSMDNAAMVSGTILSIGGLAGVVMTNVWAGFGQRKGYFRAIAYALCGTGLFIFLQSLPLGLWWFGGLQVLVGCCIVGVNPSLSSAVALCTAPEVRGRVFGLTTTAQQFGSMVGPLFASAVTTLFGIEYVFLATGALLMAVGLRVRRHHKEEM